MLAIVLLLAQLVFLVGFEVPCSVGGAVLVGPTTGFKYDSGVGIAVGDIGVCPAIVWVVGLEAASADRLIGLLHVQIQSITGHLTSSQSISTLTRS